ncbi:hypothetical protein HDU98_002706 [Podochytrium sp. JEL0797]|nr:hypothetical protein HDU98_002706 [Podochytrium sp. JEL0797]
MPPPPNHSETRPPTTPSARGHRSSPSSSSSSSRKAPNAPKEAKTKTPKRQHHDHIIKQPTPTQQRQHPTPTQQRQQPQQQPPPAPQNPPSPDRLYAGATFQNAPDASNLPIPKFSKTPKSTNSPPNHPLVSHLQTPTPSHAQLSRSLDTPSILATPPGGVLSVSVKRSSLVASASSQGTRTVSNPALSGGYTPSTTSSSSATSMASMTTPQPQPARFSTGSSVHTRTPQADDGIFSMDSIGAGLPFVGDDFESPRREGGPRGGGVSASRGTTANANSNSPRFMAPLPPQRPPLFQEAVPSPSQRMYVPPMGSMNGAQMQNPFLNHVPPPPPSSLQGGWTAAGGMGLYPGLQQQQQHFMMQQQQQQFMMQQQQQHFMMMQSLSPSVHQQVYHDPMQRSAMGNMQRSASTGSPTSSSKGKSVSPPMTMGSPAGGGEPHLGAMSQNLKTLLKINQ